MSDIIFYPCIPYERNEFADADNHYNCPIVTSYAENIKNNMDPIVHGEVDFMNPFLALTSEETITDGLVCEFTSAKDIFQQKKSKMPLMHAWEELAACRQDMRKKGEETLAYMEEDRNPRHCPCRTSIPYTIRRSTTVSRRLITSYGLAVLTEDSISHLNPVERPLIVMDQWMYHSRLYAAANFVKTRDDLDLIQLNSFGCGLDAVTTDACCRYSDRFRQDLYLS